jgi:primosomal protein N''
MHVQVIVSRKDATNTIKLSPMNTSRGKNEQHSKKMGQFDRVAFKQSGENLFDSLFEFDRGLKDTMAYANTQKNGSLAEKMEMQTLELEMQLTSKRLPEQENRNTAITVQPDQEFSEHVNVNITDDVDDEAVYGRNRRRHQSRGR